MVRSWVALGALVVIGVAADACSFRDLDDLSANLQPGAADGGPGGSAGSGVSGVGADSSGAPGGRDSGMTGTGGAAGADTEGSMGAAGAGTATAGAAGGPTTATLLNPCDEPFSFRCAGPAQAQVLVCLDGEWTTKETCQLGKLCDSSLPATDGARCAVPVADCVGREPGSTYCDGSTIMRCGADLISAKVVTDCGDELRCALRSDDDQCAVCTPGEYTCNGGPDLSVCAEGDDAVEDYQGFVPVTSCATTALCNPTAGACTSAACSADQVRCNGKLLEQCNGSQTAFTLVEDCGSSVLCNLADERCNVCNPDATRCNGANTAVETCRADGTGWTVSDSCGSNETCSSASCQCDAESESTTCAGKCGNVKNNCGDTVLCGTSSCTGYDTCGGGGTSNVCGCTPVSAQEACTGNCSAPDGCGGTIVCPCLDPCLEPVDDPFPQLSEPCRLQ